MSDAPDVYPGKKIAIHFEGARCIHSRHCVLGRPDVFVPNAAGAWIQPDAASPETIAALAQNCPSGAITYERLDGGEPEAAPLVNVIRALENGPLAVRADLLIDGQPRRFRATLCRCGASKTKPFCDKSHEAAGFVATGDCPSREAPALEKRDGALTILPQPNGPLRVAGNVEIITGTGRTITRTQKVALCRCGASASKPFCDGSHTRVGFTT